MAHEEEVGNIDRLNIRNTQWSLKRTDLQDGVRDRIRFVFR